MRCFSLAENIAMITLMGNIRQQTILILLLAALGMQGVLSGATMQVLLSSSPTQSSSFDQLHDFDGQTICGVFVDHQEESEFESEPHAPAILCQKASNALRVLHDQCQKPSLPAKVSIKKYILYHSWKAYLLS